nr:hypothetical protein [Tanacetum cinerariifolium]
MKKLSFKFFILAALLVLSFESELKVVEGRALVASNPGGEILDECSKNEDWVENEAKTVVRGTVAGSGSEPIIGSVVRDTVVGSGSEPIIGSCMSTRSSARRILSLIEDPEKLLSRKSRSEPSLLFDLEEDDMVGQARPQGPIPDLCSMEKLLQAPTDGVGDEIVVPLILVNQFELKIANGNLLTKNTQEALTIIENKSKVQASRNKTQVASASGSSTQDAYVTALTKQVEALLSSFNQPVNSVPNGCETCGGPHPYYECQATGGYTQDVYATSGTYNQGGNAYQPQRNRNLLSYCSNNYLGPPGFNQGNNHNQNNHGNNQGNNQGNYHNNQNQNYNKGNQNQEFNQNRGQNFNQEALSLMPKYHKMLKDLLSDKEKLLGLSNTSLTENCSTILLKKETLLENDPALVDVHGEELILRDGSKHPHNHGNELINMINFIDITCEDHFLEVLKFKKSNQPSNGSTTPLSDSLPSLLLEEFTDELALLEPFPPRNKDDNFDPEANLRKIEHLLNQDPSTEETILEDDPALVDVHGEELIFRNGSKHLHKHENESINMINFIDITCEDRFPEVLKFKKSNHPSNGSTTPLSYSLPSLTPFETSDSLLEDSPMNSLFLTHFHWEMRMKI